MANTIDDKVVAMSFDSSKFESGANRTLSMLERLKQALNFSGAGKGLDSIAASAGRVNLSHIGNAVDSIRSKLSMMSVAAMAVFANMAMQAVAAGTRMVKALTLDPIIQGYKEYETEINAVQTILANTRSAGTNLKDVNKALAELNTYADKTIYNFSEMTRNVGTFTAAGVDLQTSVNSIKGIANLAAVSGSNAQQAATAMYQLSQAISAGRVSLQDWLSVEHAGMAGTIFQRALAQTAVHMGTLDKNALKLTGSMKNVTINGESFRRSIQAQPGKESWLTGKVLVKTLEQLSGNLTDAQLKAQGYSDAQIKAIQSQAKAALAAATQVKTLSQLIDTTKEAIGSGWARSFKLLFGNFGEAKTLFTGLSNSIGGFVLKSSNARNKILKDWKDLGGRTLLIDSLKRAFSALGDILTPIKQAFRDIFPRKTGQDLYDLTQKFSDFVNKMKPAQSTIDNIRSTFRGLFAAFDIGKQIIGGIFTVFGRLFDAVGVGSGSFLDFTGGVGDFIVSIDQALKKGDRLKNFFSTLGDILSVPLHILQSVGHAIANLFSGLNLGAVGGLGALGAALAPSQRVILAVHTAWEAFIDGLSNTGQALQPAIKSVENLFGTLGDAIANTMQKINWDTVLNVVKVGFLGGLFLMIRKFFKGASLAQLGGDLISKIGGPFDALTSRMTVMQNQVKAKTLLEIAAAIGILALSLLALSTIKPKALDNALGGLAIAFGELLGAMKVLTLISKNAGFVKIPIIAGSMIILSTAIGILTISVKALSGLNWNELTKGLTGVGGLLAGIAIASGPLSKNSAGMISAGVGITAIAIAMKILASAVADFGGLSWAELAKGLGSIAISLGVIANASRAFPSGMVAIGAGLIVISTGLKILASAVGQFGGKNVATLAKGILGTGAALVVLAQAMKIMPKGMTAQAAALILVSVALKGIGSAIGSMGGLSLSAIAKGLATFGASLGIMALGLKGMAGSLSGAAAFTVVAAGMRLMAPAMALMGKMSWGEVAKGMIVLAAAMGVLGAAGVLLGPVAPAILALGVALAAVGGALALAGVGIAGIGVGLSAIALAGPKALQILFKAVEGLLMQLPLFGQKFAQMIVAMVNALANAAPKLIGAFTKILGMILTAIIQNAPRIGVAFGVLLETALKVLRDHFPSVLRTGFQLLMQLLQGISNNIGRVTNMAVNIVLRFLNTIASRMGSIVTAGANVLIKFLNGIANNIGRVGTAVGNIVVKFITTMGNQARKFIDAGFNALGKFVTGLGNGLYKITTKASEAIGKFVKGIADGGIRIMNAATSAGQKFITNLAKKLVDLIHTGFTAIEHFLTGLRMAIDQHGSEIVAEGMRVAGSIIKGIAKGIRDGAPDLGWDILSAVKDIVLTPIEVPVKLVGKVVQGIPGVGKLFGGNAARAAVNEFTTNLKKAAKAEIPGAIAGILGFLGSEFYAGVRGVSIELSYVDQAFKDLGTKISDSISNTRDKIKSAQDNLNSLMKEKKKNWDAINSAKNTIRVNQNLLNLLEKAQNQLNTGFAKQRQDLNNYAKELDRVRSKLEEARQGLAEAIQTRDDAIRGYTEDYSQLPSLTDEDNEPIGLNLYMTRLKNQIAAIQTYSATLNQLRFLGMDDATYRKLLAEGPADQAFANELLNGGVNAIKQLNRLDNQLTSAAEILGKNAGLSLYQAGVDAARGIVDGLASREAEIEQEMIRIANFVIGQMKRVMGIHSPSTVFMAIGAQILGGLSVGIDKNVGTVTKSIDTMAKKISDAMASISTDIEPTITPILDLSNINTESQRINQMLGAVPLTVDVSTLQASAISLPTPESPEDIPVVGGNSIKFEQNNYSPKSLSEIEIYRQTRNQLSLAKSALGG